MKLLQKCKSNPSRTVPGDLSLLRHDAVLLGEKRLHCKSSGPFSLRDATPKCGHYNSSNTMILIQWYSITSQKTWICGKTAVRTCNLTEKVFSPKDTISHNDSGTTKIPKLCCSFSPLSALHLPHQGICHPVLNERPHLYFLRFNLLTALRNVIRPLALSATRREMTLTHHTRIMVTIHTNV